MTAAATSPIPTPIRCLLVANRGEIARRIMRTARAMGISTVAVFSDADATSPHVAEADQAVHLPGTAPSDTYLSSALLVDAAARAGADAVHPGYGFLSESGDFARVVEGAGFTWVGPGPDAIDVMGSKIDAKALMAGAGVPTLPSVVVEEDELPDDEEVEALGWPVLVKASAGGGGRGMRIVGGPVNLRDAVEGARREAAAAFGDGTVFLERYVTDPRHIEVQVLADHHGETVALFERECSIQRRHQKIIEEAPSPAVDAALRDRLTEAAVAAARAVGYVNAGTVEFVLDGDGNPWFLEMNTRLQVEHPVTEAVTGLDLVRLQLLVAGGAPLPDEVFAAIAAGPRGHAIEARIYAEDPARQWRPSTGTLHRFDLDDDPGLTPAGASVGTVRVDAGVASGSVVSPHYDSMLAKVVAHAPNRDEASTVLATALTRARIHGVTTNRDLLVATLSHPEFRAGDTDTGFLDRIGLGVLAAPLTPPEARRRHAVAAALCAQAARRQDATVQRPVPSGFRNNRDALEEVTWEPPAGADPRGWGGTLDTAVDGAVDGAADGTEGTVTVGYRFDRRDRPAEVAVDGEAWEVEASSLGPERAVLTIDGVRRTYSVHRVEATFYVDGPDGHSVLVERDRFPVAADQVAEGSSLAPLPGGVVRVAVAVGDRVERGQVLVVLEAMKMEHSVTAAASGTVRVVDVAVGDQVETGRILAVVETADGAEGDDGATAPPPAAGTAGAEEEAS